MLLARCVICDKEDLRENSIKARPRQRQKDTVEEDLYESVIDRTKLDITEEALYMLSDHRQ